MPRSRNRPNLSQIAAMLDVSTATVSNALSGKGRVSAGLSEKIREMAVDVGYVPGTAGRALRTGRSNVLGLVLPDISNPLFPQIAQAIENAASRAGYGVLIADSRGGISTQTQAIGRLLERGVDGVVVVPRRGTRITDIGRPVAVIDSPSTPGNTVSADHWQGGQLIADHLVGLGHRNILLLANHPESNVQNDRIGGLRSRLPADVTCRILWTDDLERRHGPGCSLGLRGYFNAGVTAFAAVLDLLALRALTELLGAGVSVPRQASVTGFDDLSWSSVVHPALTTVRMDMPRIAEIAITTLTDAIEGRATVVPVRGPVTPVPPNTGTVPMTLIVRQTTGAPLKQALKLRKDS